MIPILYKSSETQFNSNGIGSLVDCIRCIATEERNGIYEVEFDYPISGKLFDEIKLGRIIAVTHDTKGDVQPFIIYRRSIPDLNGIVTFNAHHISYRLADIVVMPFAANSCGSALNGIRQHSANDNPFTFWTDKATNGAFNSTVPRLARNILGGEENSILDVYGSGDYEFDMFNVRLYKSRGRDTGLEIRYGKNLETINQEIDDSGTYNAIVPYWADTEGNTLTLPEQIISYAAEHERIDAAPMDLTSHFEEIPTAEQLRQTARRLYESGDAWLPSENIQVNFVQLWQTEEYKEYAALQRVGLCDAVDVIYPKAGINKIKQKVIKVVYNVLLERFDEIELGQPTTSLGQQVRETLLQEVPTIATMSDAIKYAGDLIRGGLGGYIVMPPGENGYPQELLIMDTPDINTAVNIIRLNRGGIAFSQNGYGGPFNSAWNIDGSFIANFIKAGTISDAEGVNYWNLETGELVTTRGTIAGFDISGTVIEIESGNRRVRLNHNGLHERRYNPDINESTRISIASARIFFYLEDGDVYPDNAFSDITIDYDTNNNKSVFWYVDDQEILSIGPITRSWAASFLNNLSVDGNFKVFGTKSREVKTDSYDKRLLYSYETPAPLFGDVGEAVLDDDGFCYVSLDPIFAEAIGDRYRYQVFLQKEGPGDCWVADKAPTHFVVEGTPGLTVAWEVKSAQKGYENLRLDPSESILDEYSSLSDGSYNEYELYINEQEGLLYD